MSIWETRDMAHTLWPWRLQSAEKPRNVGDRKCVLSGRVETHRPWNQDGNSSFPCPSAFWESCLSSQKKVLTNLRYSVAKNWYYGPFLGQPTHNPLCAWHCLCSPAPQIFMPWVFVVLWEIDSFVSSFPFSSSFWSLVGSLAPRSLYTLQQDQGSDWP